MKPADRVRLIRRITANFLKYEDQTDIDLILEQFKLKTIYGWEGDMKSYVVAVVKNGTDEKLQELDVFLLEELEPHLSSDVLTASVNSCWAQAPLHIFISHSSLNKDEVTSLKICLLPYGATAFVAHEDISPTEEWQSEIICALDTCHAVVAWTTVEFKESPWAQQEIGMALSMRKPIISVKRGIDPVGFAAKEQGLNGNFDFSQLAKNIVDILIKKNSTQRYVQEGLLTAFTNVGTYVDARTKMSLLEKFNTWDHLQLDRLARAVRVNDQVSDSSGVPKRVTALINRFAPRPPEILIDDLPF